ncbi:MAG: glycosyltransferase family 2 protein [Desulfuromonadaceae bacterium]|nr:glycosyltransferase family 2 protein [Desulfuromonadaceae bacterium]
MNTLINILMWIHFCAMGILALYGCHRLWMLYHWHRLKKMPARVGAPSIDCTSATVTVQLPMYNEQFVAKRIIDAAAQLRWPVEQLQIQVLDDSTDATCDLVDNVSAFWRARGIDIEVLRRNERSGYKAGALAEGLRSAKGEFVAIFDADFVPHSDFLRRMLPHFSTPETGMVQARWSFLNRESSWLTRVQGLLLGPHFGIEHQVRNTLGAFFNFNGTAGIWRKHAIVDAGGWESDTVTEDLDLSYRAQLRGWRFRYVDDVVVPSELPITLADFRAQQQRWAKGSIQTACKLLPAVLKARQPLRVKLEACAHLLANFGWVCGAVASLTLYPALLGRGSISTAEALLIDLPLFVLACGAILSYFFCYAYRATGLEHLRWLPILPLLTLGISPSLATASIAGLFQHGGTFNRTAKYGVLNKKGTSIIPLLSVRSSVPRLAFYTVLIVYSCLPVTLVPEMGYWASIPFLCIFPLSFSLVAFREAADTFIHR